MDQCKESQVNRTEKEKLLRRKVALVNYSSIAFDQRQL